MRCSSEKSERSEGMRYSRRNVRQVEHEMCMLAAQENKNKVEQRKKLRESERNSSNNEEKTGEAGAVAKKTLTAEVGTQTEGMTGEALKRAMASLQAEIEQLDSRPVADPVVKAENPSMSPSSGGGAVRRYVQLSDMKAVPPPTSYESVNPRTARLLGYERRPSAEPTPSQSEPVVVKPEPEAESSPTQQEPHAPTTEPAVDDEQSKPGPSGHEAVQGAENDQLKREPAVTPEPVRLNWWKPCHNCHQRTHYVLNLTEELPEPQQSGVFLVLVDHGRARGRRVPVQW